jgi:hypothetical protein
MTMTITIVGMLALICAAVAGDVHHVTVRVDNQTALAVQIDGLDAGRDRVGLGEADARILTTFQEQGLGKVRARLIGDGRGEWAQVDEEAGTGFTVIVR